MAQGIVFKPYPQRPGTTPEGPAPTSPDLPAGASYRPHIITPEALPPQHPSAAPPPQRRRRDTLLLVLFSVLMLVVVIGLLWTLANFLSDVTP